MVRGENMGYVAYSNIELIDYCINNGIVPYYLIDKYSENKFCNGL